MSGNGGDDSAATTAASVAETAPRDQQTAPATAAKPDTANEPSHAEKDAGASEKSAGDDASTAKDTAAVDSAAAKDADGAGSQPTKTGEAASASANEASAAAGVGAQDASSLKSGAAEDKPAPKKRGRPPKKDKEVEAGNGENEASKRAKASPTTPPKKRGRPPKKLVEERARAKAEADAAAGITTDATVAAEGGNQEAASTPGDDEKGDDERASAEKSKKRKSSLTIKATKDGDASNDAAAASAGEDTESEPEKQPKKRAKTSTAKASKDKKSPARKKKAVVEEESDSENEAQKEAVARVEALDPEVKAKFGNIVWAKMVGYPYWPALITDPRCLPPKFQTAAMKDLDTKYLVYFYSSKNFAPTLFKNIESWDDTKNNYREGFPVKDSKAPKRRAQLMEAIAEADKEFLLPVVERVDGLLKPIVKEPKPKKESKPAQEEATPEKRRGRPPGAKNKVQKPASERKSKKKEKKGGEEADGDNREKSTKDNDGEDADEPSQESVEEEEELPVTHSLSKEEIKAKIASRKTPSKKKLATDDSDAKSKSGAAKKQSVATGKTGGKSAPATEEIDTKRKKEIELVVPRKSVKSADIREMTEEAAKKKLGGAQQSEKTKKDKGEYQVGDLGSFASKLTRFHANESSKNNDEVIQMLNQLFEEKVMFRSDVERSGLAAIIALLRKSSNPTVAQTASALRKHLMNIIRMDTGGDASAPVKAAKAPVAEDGSISVSKKSKDAKASSDKKDEPRKAVLKEQKDTNGVAKPKQAAEADKTAGAVSADRKPKPAADAKAASTTPGVAVKPAAQKEDVAAAASKDAEDSKAESGRSSFADASKDAKGSSAAQAATEKSGSDGKKADASLDKNRQAFVDMLNNVLELSGPRHSALAKEIEEFVFDRYQESNDDYMVQARKITFGLKGNKNLRDRLFSGTLHGLELVYADDKFFEASP